jgi:hypothetical protein
MIFPHVPRPHCLLFPAFWQGVVGFKEFGMASQIAFAVSRAGPLNFTWLALLR